MSHPNADALAEYWLGDLSQTEMEALENHLFSCQECTTANARMAALPRALAFAVQPVISSAEAARLQSLDDRVLRTVVTPGGRGIADFSSGVEAQLVVLQGDLTGASRVDVTLCTRDGTPFLERQDVPFDSEAGTVTIACRSHYLTDGQLPLAVSVRVSAITDAGTRSVGTFDIDHIAPL